MSPHIRHPSPLLLRQQLLFLLISSLQLLDALVVVVDGCSEGSLSTLLADDELVEVVVEELGSDAGGAGETAGGERSGGLLVGHVFAREGLVREGERSGAGGGGELASATAASTSGALED